MKTAIYKGGMFGEGAGETLSCCLCGEKNFEKLIVQRIGIAIGMSGDDYTFCESCWNGPNFGSRLLQFLGYPNGMRLMDKSLEFREIQDER